jgi:hypothetical protein
MKMVIIRWVIGLRKLQKMLNDNAAAKKFAVRSEGMAEGGCGGSSAMPERNQIVDSPAVLLESAGHHRKILFPLGEKEIRREQNEKSKGEIGTRSIFREEFLMSYVMVDVEVDGAKGNAEALLELNREFRLKMQFGNYSA